MTTTLTSTVEFNADLLRKYNQPLPRYTSYPPATEMKAPFSGDALRSAIGSRQLQKKRPSPSTATFPFATAPATSAAATPSLLAIRMWPILTSTT